MLHLPAFIVDLALILGAAAVTSLLFKKLKQPVVLGYIIAGLIVGPSFDIFPTVVETKSITTWADIGVIFLLFSLGLEFSFKKLMKVGGVAVATALCGVGFTMFLGFGVAKLLGWGHMDSLFLGGILAIASTTIIIRAFDELNLRTLKFTQIVLGVLVIEDLVAVVLMVLLSTVAVTRTFEGGEMIFSILKLVFFLILWFVSGIFFLPSLLQKLKKLMNDETLLIVSLSLCFLMVYLATQAGFSPALGAFIMGSILAETTKAEKIEHIIKPIKNLFGAVFFVSVGMLINPDMLVEHIGPILVSTAVLLFGKPLFVTIGALTTGQPLKIAVQTGMSLSQIGEFSFIIAALGLSLNVTSDFLYPIAVAVSVLTTFTTPFMMKLSEPASKFIEKILPQKWKFRLDKYAVGAQEVKNISDWKKLLRFYLINTVIFSVISITIILLSTQYLQPMLDGYKWGKITNAVLTLIILSPFLWALAFRRTQKEAYANVWLNKFQRGPLIILLIFKILLVVLFIGFLFDRLFSPTIAIMGVIITCIILLIFRRKIRLFYAKIELRFLSNFNQREENEKTKPHKVLTPWDTHLSSLELDPLSSYVGKTLLESQIRENFEVNIATIERGGVMINVPDRFERLYPYDILSIIGTDEQLKKFKAHLESTLMNNTQIEDRQKKEISLESFLIDKDSFLVGKTIRMSSIRELTKGLVVGIEKEEDRILNPDSGYIFEPFDKVWIVGNKKRIQVFSSRFKGIKNNQVI